MVKAQPAPAPWDFTASGKPGSNGELNIYITDKTGRKIAAVWGKHEEKNLTACLMISAPDMLAELRKAIAHIEHMGAWISANNKGYSFESIGEDMPGMKSVIAQAMGGEPPTHELTPRLEGKDARSP